MQTESANPSKKIARTAIIAAAVFVIPILIASVFIHFLGRFRSPSPARTIAATNLANLPDDPAALAGIRENMRTNGIDVGGVNLRIWAARAACPDVLFTVAPPSTGKDWSWRLTRDGRCALAVSVQSSGNGSREVGLYDLIEEKWLWVQPMPWPDQIDQPIRVSERLLVRYAKNGNLFALEISPSGRIASIEPLGRGHISSLPEPEPDPRFPGTPVALFGGVFFTSGAGGGLTGYAANRLPGLWRAADLGAHTAFSGNGLLRFDVAGSDIRVNDALTGTQLLQVNAWPNTTNTTILATSANENGSLFTVFLQTDFGGHPAVSRKWTATLDTASGRISRSFDTDVSVPAPEQFTTSAVSPDGGWELAAGISNTLSIVSCTSSSAVARVTIPAETIRFLPAGNHALLRAKNDCWMLDFATARHYADWLANLSSGTNMLPADLVAKQELQNLKDEAYYSFSTTSEDIARLTNGTALAELQTTAKPSRAPAFLALKAQIFAANGAWPYAVYWMREMQTLQESDMRAPRVNTFLLARLAMLAGDTETVRDCCRREYAALSYSNSEDARMVMFHIRALFAKTR